MIPKMWLQTSIFGIPWPHIRQTHRIISIGFVVQPSISHALQVILMYTQVSEPLLHWVILWSGTEMSYSDSRA